MGVNGGGGVTGSPPEISALLLEMYKMYKRTSKFNGTPKSKPPVMSPLLQHETFTDGRGRRIYYLVSQDEVLP